VIFGGVVNWGFVSLIGSLSWFGGMCRELEVYVVILGFVSWIGGLCRKVWKFVSWIGGLCRDSEVCVVSRGFVLAETGHRTNQMSYIGKKRHSMLSEQVPGTMLWNVDRRMRKFDRRSLNVLCWYRLWVSHVSTTVLVDLQQPAEWHCIGLTTAACATRRGTDEVTDELRQSKAWLKAEGEWELQSHGNQTTRSHSLASQRSWWHISWRKLGSTVICTDSLK